MVGQDRGCSNKDQWVDSRCTGSKIRRGRPSRGTGVLQRSQLGHVDARAIRHLWQLRGVLGDVGQVSCWVSGTAKFPTLGGFLTDIHGLPLLGAELEVQVSQGGLLLSCEKEAVLSLCPAAGGFLGILGLARLSAFISLRVLRCVHLLWGVSALFIRTSILLDRGPTLLRHGPILARGICMDHVSRGHFLGC